MPEPWYLLWDLPQNEKLYIKRDLLDGYNILAFDQTW
jgi:hypothetical protein